MSGSTKGWINDVERETLLLLSEALETLGDRYAIYGFSGMTRKKCELFRIKRFDEDYGADVQGRISAIRPRDYTRMGFAVRHATHLLGQVDARRRLLIVISDGKPDDYSDRYRGPYGIEDTRRALQQAVQAGVRPFCITVDKEARDYLPQLYGSAHFTVVDDVARLPYKVGEVYRRLTH
jgi:nitric oxide reductase NorD protein